MAVLFRNQYFYSPFKRALIKLISIPKGDELFLFYGYVSEKILIDENGNPDIEIVKAINNGMPNGGTIYLFSGRFLSKGCKNYNKGDAKYEKGLEKLANQIQSELRKFGSNADVKYCNYHEEMMKKPQWDEESIPHWHAKLL